MSSVKNCNRCKKDLELTLFNKWKNGEYLLNCIDCNNRKLLAKKKTHKTCSSCNQIKPFSHFKNCDKGKSNFCLDCFEKREGINKEKRIQRYYKNKAKCVIETNARTCSRCYNKKDNKQFNQRKNGEYHSTCIECNNKRKISSAMNRKNKMDDINGITPDSKKCSTCFNIKELSEFKKNKKSYTRRCIECLSKILLNINKRKEYDVSDTNNKKCIRCCLVKPIEMFKQTKKGIQKQCEECCIHYKKLNKERKQRLIITDLKDDEKQCTRCFEVKNLENFITNNHKHCNTCITSHKEYLIKNRCEHGCLNKSACYKCLGGSICIHKHKKSECKECNFKGYLYQKVKTRIGLSIKKESKNMKTIEYLGCNIETFKQHLEQKFVEGMNWENYGKIWHIDHIIPIAYKNPSLDEVIQRLHYLNTQPLWASENISKGNRYIG